MIKRALPALMLFTSVFLWTALAEGEGPPPALVVTGKVTEAVVAPTADFVGTVYYVEVSTVAAEVAGKAVEVRFDEGDRVREGRMLVRVDSALLERRIEAASAAYEQVLINLERAKKDLGRSERLFAEEFVSEEVFEQTEFAVRGLRQKAVAMKAEIGGLEVELLKKKVRAPFDGVVLRKSVNRGEWLSPGSPVATIARGGEVEVVVDVPEPVMRSVKKGTPVVVIVAGEKVDGKVKAVVPQGNVRTRTFPVKIGIKKRRALVEGMEAVVTLPTGARTRSIMVPRDALISQFGMTVVFVVAEGKAKMMPVNVTAYSGSDAAVAPGILKVDMDVVVKGNERLRDGQDVMVKGAAPPPAAGGAEAPAKTTTKVRGE